ncbi:MAG: glycosyltransferase family 8 protein, partial [Sphingobacteriaceae bacterium]
MNNASKTISIVVTSDNHYCVMIAALIKSIEVNHKSGENIELIIIDDGISKRNKSKLQNSIDNNVTKIKWVSSNAVIPKNIKIPADQSTLPHTIYMRLFAPNLVDERCKKLIYLDVDMILYDDISNLFNIDIGDNIIGAVQDYILTFDSSTGVPNYAELGFPAKAKYFNAGLLV